MAVLFDDPTVLFDDPDVTFDGALIEGPPAAPPAPYGTTPTRDTANYELQLWQRTPNQLTAATYVEVGRIVSPTITWSHELDADGTLQASCQADRLDADVRQALRDAFTPDAAPQGVELRLIRNGTTVWAGPMVGHPQMQGGTLTLAAHGLAYYLRGMWVTTDLTYSSVDQYTIGKGLVDHWLGLDYGNFHIDTSSIGTSGTTRDRTYLAAELPNVHDELSKLAAVNGGFNWWVDPATRTLTFATERGSDLSGSVVFDRRNIADAGIAGDTAAGEFGSEAFGVGTAAENEPITSTQSDTAVRSTFGRWGIAASFDGVSRQTTLDSHTTQYLNDRNRPSFFPGPRLTPIKDADVGDFAPGDTVTWSYDAGLGLQTFARRLLKVQTTVDVNGAETMSVEFA